MMMDDIINDKRICPMCGKETDYMSMVWLDGICTCAACYEIRRNDIKDFGSFRKSKEVNSNEIHT